MLLDDARAVKLGTVNIRRMMKEGFEVWPKTPVDITAVATRWDQVSLTIIPPMIGADSYVIRRNGTQIYADVGLTFLDTLLMPDTTYIYTVDAIDSGVVRSSGLDSVKTPVRAKPVLSGSSSRWDQVALSWTDPDGGSVDKYRLKRGTTEIYKDTPKLHTDAYPASSLMPSTAYSYTVEALRGATVISTSAAVSVTTAEHTDMGLTYSGLTHDYVLLTWADTTQYTIDKYSVYQNDATWVEDSTSAGDKAAGIGGLAASTGYSYTVRAYRNGTEIPPRDSTSFTTAAAPPPPTSTGYAETSKTHITSGGYTGITQRNLEGGSLTFPYGGTMTSIVIAVWGYNDGNNPSGNGRVEPWVGGVARQHSVIGNVNVGQTNELGLENIGFAAGTHSVGMRVGGSTPEIPSWGQVEWDVYSPYSNWKTQVYVDGIHYWYYTAADDPDELARRRALPWWDESLLGRDTHTVSRADSDTGEFTAVRITDKETGELLVEWEAPPKPEQQIAPEA